MKALFRVSDGWIFNAPCDESRLTQHEKDLIEIDKIWVLTEVPIHIPAEHIKHYGVIDGEFILLPEENWPDYMPPEDEE